MVSKKNQPSIDELKAAHAAESKAISEKIADGYDFEKEMGSSIFDSLFGAKSSIEMNRERLKKRKSFDSASPSP